MKTETGRILFPSSRLFFFSYFIGLSILGSMALQLPGMWEGPIALSLLDGLFTSVSAVCVTGLIVVDTAQFTYAGKTVIMLLIQLGGLGLVAFSTLYLLAPRAKISFSNRRLMKEYFIDDVEYDPRKIVKSVIVITLLVEGVGFVILSGAFLYSGNTNWLFDGLFHSVSAFCNAGFSTFTTNLVEYQKNPVVLLTISMLLVFGGLGFIVIHELVSKKSGIKRRFTLHTLMVLVVTAVLIGAATVLIFLSEHNAAFANMSLFDKLVNSLFASVAPRTAGFNSQDMLAFTTPSIVLIMGLMFIGAAPGSTAGGIKVTAFAVVLLTVLRGVDPEGKVKVGNRKLPQLLISKATILTIRAALYIIIIAIVITAAENTMNPGMSFQNILFEVISAFGTVGLSMGITAGLSVVGKIAIIVTMLVGRLGVLSLLFSAFEKADKDTIEFPEEEVMIG